MSDMFSAGFRAGDDDEFSPGEGRCDGRDCPVHRVCPYCDGSGQDECRSCSGEGTSPCEECDGEGVVAAEDQPEGGAIALVDFLRLRCSNCKSVLPPGLASMTRLIECPHCGAALQIPSIIEFPPAA